LLDAILSRPALRPLTFAGDTGGGLAALRRRACDTGVIDLASDPNGFAVCGGGVMDLPDPGGGVSGLIGDSGL